MLPTPTKDQRRAVVLARWKLRRAFLKTLDEINVDAGCGCQSCLNRSLEDAGFKERYEAKQALASVVDAIVRNRNGHYLAHSHDCENAVSYARQEGMKFLPERRTRTTLGRYIRRNFPDCKVADDFLEQFTSKVMSKLTSADKRFSIVSGDDITRAYRDEIGGRSCMTGDDSDKVEIYAINPDVVRMLVYDDGDSLTGRCLIWKTNQGHTVADRIYPNSGRNIDEFKEYIKKHGWHMRENQSYPCGQGFIGLDRDEDLTVTLKVPDPPIYPYMDTFRMYRSSDVDWDNRTITLHTYDGTDRLDSTSGEGPGAGGRRVRCCACSDRVDDDDAYTNEYGDYFCRDCYYDRYTSCDRCGREVSTDDTCSVTVGRYSQESWCEPCVRNHAYECEQCNEYYSDEIRLATVEGVLVCDSCHGGNFSTCHGCGNTFYDENLTERGDEYYCSDCLPDEKEEYDDESNAEATDADAETAEVATAPI